MKKTVLFGVVCLVSLFQVVSNAGQSPSDQTNKPDDNKGFYGETPGKSGFYNETSAKNSFYKKPAGKDGYYNEPAGKGGYYNENK